MQTPAVASPEDLLAEVARLREENAKLSARPPQSVAFKVSEKGALSVYGLGRFPVTLYATQWTRLLDNADAIRAFMAENTLRLATKH